MARNTHQFRFAGGLLACVCTLASMQAWAQSYPRAQAAAAAQRVAAGLDGTVRPLAPLLPALGGVRGEAVFEDALGTIYRVLDAYTLAETRWQHAQQLALAAGDPGSAADIAIARGEIALVSGDYAHVERLSNEAAVLAQRAHLVDAEARAEEYLGVIDRRHGQFDDAVAHEQRALELQRQCRNDDGIAAALTNLGTIARERGDYAQALDFQLQALAIRERTQKSVELTLRNLALIYRDLGDDAATRSYFTRAQEAAARNGDNGNYTAVLGTFASYLADVREFAPALAAGDEALAIGRASGHRPSVGYDLIDSSRALLGLGRRDEAVARLRQALALGHEMNQTEIVARSEVALAEAALQGDDRRGARELLDAASPQAMQSKPLLVQVYALREQLATSEGDHIAALDFAHRQAALREELLGTRANRRLSALETQYARAASEQKLALVTKDNELQASLLAQQQLQRKFGLAVLAGLTALLALIVWRFFGVRRLNRTLAARNAEIDAKRAALADANDRLEHQAHQLYQAAITDPLTGVFNRGHMMRTLDAMITDCVRDGHELAVLLIDFDNFKQINDARGHLFGDRVLVGGVQTLRQWLEPHDLLGRYGGEEFVVAIAGRGIAEVRAQAERLRVRVAETLAAFAPELAGIATISIGIAQLKHFQPPVRLETLIEAADKAVYMAKARGRNKVMEHAA